MLIILVAGITTYAQPIAPQSKLLDKKEIDGLTVQLKQAPANTYLFDISEHGLRLGLQHNNNNPVTMLPQGFNSKEDAYKIATWMIQEYKKTGHIPPVVPMHIARQLDIAVEKLYPH